MEPSLNSSSKQSASSALAEPAVRQELESVRELFRSPEWARALARLQERMAALLQELVRSNSDVVRGQILGISEVIDLGEAVFSAIRSPSPPQGLESPGVEEY